MLEEAYSVAPAVSLSRLEPSESRFPTVRRGSVLSSCRPVHPATTSICRGLPGDVEPPCNAASSFVHGEEDAEARVESPPGRRPGVPHRSRPSLSRHHPVHVTVRLAAGLPKLRRRKAFKVVQRAIRAAHKDRFRIVEFSVLQNHLHLIVEADDAEALARGMQGLQIRLAKGLNRLWGRKGRVFADRYHARVLSTPSEVRRALAYCLCNARRHAWQHGRHVLAPDWVDPYSSGPTFSGWRERFPGRGPPEDLVRLPETWLLRKGWRRRGLIPVAEIPGRPRG